MTKHCHIQQRSLSLSSRQLYVRTYVVVVAVDVCGGLVAQKPQKERDMFWSIFFLFLVVATTTTFFYYFIHYYSLLLLIEFISFKYCFKHNLFDDEQSTSAFVYLIGIAISYCCCL